MTDSSERTHDPLSPYQHALRDRFPSVEAITAAAHARRRKRRRQYTAATMALFLAAVATWVADPVYRTEQFAAGSASQTVPLADGSIATLDKDTQLTVHWALRSRTLSLDRGEAVFTVAHGLRSFVVTAGDTRVRDIGTVFDVQRLPRRTRVTVLEGAVEVEAGGHTRTLRASQRVDVEADGRPGNTVSVNPERALAWQRDKFSFDGATLADAIAEMQPHAPSPIVIDDPRVAQLRLSGEFDRDQVEAILRLLPGILPVSVRGDADGSVHLSARPRP
ncbi:FecR family protein [Cupriavidus plantarum]|uniref:FecR family protein n=1 Tax=Cupriavidus plantarum TaxID=942865 RepID=A0A316EQ10_9BURK|nr:FecR domain-containing protein [Cupriavidus plantarum]PWK34175.1 FecR family protein [Cupriavidus plantarum]